MNTEQIISAAKIILLDPRVLISLAVLLVYIKFVSYVAKYKKKTPKVRVRKSQPQPSYSEPVAPEENPDTSSSDISDDSFDIL